MQKEKFLAGEGANWVERNKDKVPLNPDPVMDEIKNNGIEPKEVLEIGCGNGWRLTALNERYGCACVGIDPSQGNNEAADDLSKYGNQFDLVMGWTFSRRISVNLNINNLTDSEGVMTWRGWGANTGDRQSFTTLPATGKDTMLQYVPIQPRAYHLTTTYKF